MTITGIEARFDVHHEVLRDVILHHPRFTIRQYVKANVEMVKANTRLSKGDRHKLINEWVAYEESFDED
jgi:hypothetical protein